MVVLALIWLVFASVSDLRKREVPNWLSFSLITFALVYRAVYAVIFSNLMFFIYGLLGLGVFIALGYLFYYGRLFAGGDTKLLMSLGPILPFAASIYSNLVILAVFLLIMLFAGSIYGLIWSTVLAVINKKTFFRELKKQFKARKNLFYISFLFFVASLVIVLLYRNLSFVVFPIIFILFPILYIYAKSVEEICMIKLVNVRELTEGDWLYSAVKVKGKIIKPNWEGLSLKELKLLKSYRGKVKVKQGIPFVPVFLLAFIILIIVLNLIFA